MKNVEYRNNKNWYTDLMGNILISAIFGVFLIGLIKLALWIISL